MRRVIFASLFCAVSSAVLLSPATGDAQQPGIEQQLDDIEAEIQREQACQGQDAGACRDAGRTDRSDEAGDLDHSNDNRVSESARTAETSTSIKSGSSGASDGLLANWSLYRDPIIVGLVAGGILALLGVYVVSRRIVFVSAALSQVSALGVTLGFGAIGLFGLTGWAAAWLPPSMAVAASLAMVWWLTSAGDDPSLPRDAILGTSFVVPMALVLLLAPYIPQEMHEIQSILHGSAVVVRTEDLWAILICGALVLATQLASFRSLLFASLDPDVARMQGLPVTGLHALLFGSIAVMTGLATRAIGALPTFAMTLLPALGAVRLTTGLTTVFAASALGGALSGAGGYLLAYHLSWSVGAAQTLAATTWMVALRLAAPLFD